MHSTHVKHSHSSIPAFPVRCTAQMSGSATAAWLWPFTNHLQAVCVLEYFTKPQHLQSWSLSCSSWSFILGEAQCIFVCRYTDAAALRDNLRQIEQQSNLAQAQADGLKELRQSSKNFRLGKRVANKKANWKGVVVG